MKDYERKILEVISKNSIRYGKLKKFLGVKKKTERDYLDELLLKLQLQGMIYYDGVSFCPFSNKNIITKVESYRHKEGMQACFKLDDGRIIPIEEENLNGAFVGDIVVLEWKKRKVLRVLKRQIPKITCEVVIEGDVKKLRPLRILGQEYLQLRISEKDMKRLVEGDIISVNVDTQKYDEYYEATFKERLGHKDDPDIVLNVIASNHGFSLNYSKESLEQLKYITDEISDEELKKRLDLRNEEIFTIDGSHTKDMDDAISLKKLDNGNYELGVHIADVAHYLPINSPLWKDAVERATSLYMVNTVIPMIPHQLSNGVCSLNEGVDRLTNSCIMEVTPEGKIVHAFVTPSVIRSKKKMTYESVEEVLNGVVVPGYESFVDTLKEMNGLAKTISKKRGSLPFDSSDLEYTINEDKNIIGFNQKEQSDSMNLIEQFMVMANVSVSLYSTHVGLPTPYRIHEEPSEFKIEETLNKLRMNGFDIEDCVMNDSYRTLYQILLKYHNTVEYPYISDLILRSMKKAKYSSFNEGHYALKERYYSHFTSPIRRLPDLLLHHQIKTVFDGYCLNHAINESQMETLCQHASFMEREAESAEKEADEYTLLQYMNTHKNKYYIGFVKEVKDDCISIITKQRIKGKILFRDLPQEVVVSIKDNSIYYKGHLILKIGNALRLNVSDIDFVRNEVIFQLDKNLSLSQVDKDYSLTLKKNIG